MKSVREAMLKCDWTTDKFYQLPGRNGKYTDVHYVSLPKITRNANMVFLDNNMDFKIDMLSMVETEKGCRLTADVILTDLDSDEQDITHIIASAPISDKDSSVALAYVRRQYFSSRFGIVDGLNFDEDSGENNLTNALYAKAVEPVNVPAEAVSKPVVTKPTPMVSLNEVKQQFKPAERSKNLSAMEEKSCVQIMQIIESNKDLIENEVYEKAKAIFENRQSGSDALALMEIKRMIDSKQPPKQEGM